MKEVPARQLEPVSCVEKKLKDGLNKSLFVCFKIENSRSLVGGVCTECFSVYFTCGVKLFLFAQKLSTPPTILKSINKFMYLFTL